MGEKGQAGLDLNGTNSNNFRSGGDVTPTESNSFPFTGIIQGVGASVGAIATSIPSGGEKGQAPVGSGYGGSSGSGSHQSSPLGPTPPNNPSQSA